MKFIREITPYIIIIILVVCIRVYVITPIKVNGTSMNPTLIDSEILILKKYDKRIDRFDIVVLEYNNTKLIKRVIGLPGEHVKYVNNNLYINDNLVMEDFLETTTNDYDLKLLGVDVIPEDYYFVMGDNRNNSTDSRVIGLVSKEDILGTTSLSLYPFDRLGFVE